MLPDQDVVIVTWNIVMFPWKLCTRILGALAVATLPAFLGGAMPPTPAPFWPPPLRQTSPRNMALWYRRASLRG